MAGQTPEVGDNCYEIISVNLFRHRRVVAVFQPPEVNHTAEFPEESDGIRWHLIEFYLAEEPLCILPHGHHLLPFPIPARTDSLRLGQAERYRGPGSLCIGPTLRDPPERPEHLLKHHNLPGNMDSPSPDVGEIGDATEVIGNDLQVVY